MYFLTYVCFEYEPLGRADEDFSCWGVAHVFSVPANGINLMALFEKIEQLIHLVALFEENEMIDLLIDLMMIIFQFPISKFEDYSFLLAFCIWFFNHKNSPCKCRGPKVLVEPPFWRKLDKFGCEWRMVVYLEFAESPWFLGVPWEVVVLARCEADDEVAARRVEKQAVYLIVNSTRDFNLCKHSYMSKLVTWVVNAISISLGF